MRSGADVNGDNLWIYRAYLRISHYCRVTVRNMVRVRVGVADCCIQTARKSEKMRINHVIKTDQWRSTQQIGPRSAFCGVSLKFSIYVWPEETTNNKINRNITHSSTCWSLWRRY